MLWAGVLLLVIPSSPPVSLPLRVAFDVDELVTPPKRPIIFKPLRGVVRGCAEPLRSLFGVYPLPVAELEHVGEVDDLRGWRRQGLRPLHDEVRVPTAGVGENVVFHQACNGAFVVEILA